MIKSEEYERELLALVNKFKPAMLPGKTYQMSVFIIHNGKDISVMKPTLIPVGDK